MSNIPTPNYDNTTLNILNENEFLLKKEENRIRGLRINMNPIDDASDIPITDILSQNAKRFSNISGMNEEDSVELLKSVLNAFKLDETELESIIDKINEVDNVQLVSSEDLQNIFNKINN